MRELTNEEFKSTELRILKVFDKYCRENNLKYSLAEGTLIGAVRHKGFIPWDDDIDVMMPRIDFDRFAGSFHVEGYQLDKVSEDSKWPQFYMRLSDVRTKVIFEKDKDWRIFHSGVWIDIIPIDNFPDSDSELKCQERKLYVMFKLYRASLRNHFLPSSGFLRNIAWLSLKFISLFISRSRLREKIIKTMCTYNDKKTSRRGFLTSYWHHPWIFPARCFEGTIELEFENSRFQAIKGYDEYLRSEYGDYMQLPPEKKRVARHGFRTYWVD